MIIVATQITTWDKLQYFDASAFELGKGDRVILETEAGTELAEVISIIDTDKLDEDKIKPALKAIIESDLTPLTRVADETDLSSLVSAEDKSEALDYAKEMKTRYDLPMKFIDVHYAFDKSKITFAFIADGRVDFRSLVKDMTRHFSRTIRLEQIGIRDEAKICGDIGPCGKNLCCKTHLKELQSITSDMAEIQQCAHRGSERISGVCGRLMCCLEYEHECYKQCAKKLPEIGRKVSVDGKRGVVVGHHILKESVDVEFPAEKGGQRSRVEVDLNRNKKKE